jgi:Glyoxalase-like domain
VTLRFASIVVDCADAAKVGSFWAELLGRPLGGPDGDGDLWIEACEAEPEMIFQPVPEGKAAKNRLHIDLRPEDQAAEVARAITLGARPADVGQREVTWVVLADPEGNEFCVLQAKRPDGG